jgi:RNA polymerase sigma-70 factor (ECF subfamily)
MPGDLQLRQEEHLTNKEIADRLLISVKTVENQVAIAYKKLRTYLQPYNEQIFFLFVISLFQ